KIGQALAGNWSLATALAMLVWYIFAPQCASTLAVIRRETGSWRWMAITFGYMLALAYLAAFATYRVAVRLGGGAQARAGYLDIKWILLSSPEMGGLGQPSSE